MRRTTLLTGLAWLLATPLLPAQEPEAEPPTHVYVAYHKISFADLEAWIRDYHEHTVPIMRELQDEAVIEGWGAWQHSTASEYNWRFAIRTRGWSQLGEFWEHYLRRLEERAPEAFARGGAMIQAHYDEVWDISEAHVPDGLDVQYLYDSRFQISFADLEGWNDAWEEFAAPVLAQAMEDGLLGGWVRQGHNTGGRHNWKVLYLFEEWDDMDDLFERLLSTLTGNPEVWQRVAGMIDAHDDVIWGAVPAPDSM